MIKLEGPRSVFKGNGILVAMMAPYQAFEFFFYEFYKNNLFQAADQSELTHKQKFVCGGMAGMTCVAYTNPLNVVKTHIVTNTSTRRASVLGEAGQIVRKHGVKGLYRGYGISCSQVFPFVAIQMSSYDYFKSLKEYSIPYNAFCVAIAGTIAITAVYPADLVRKHIHLNGSSPQHQYKNVYDVMKQIYARSGSTGFFKGYYATIVKVIPMNMIMFVCNE